MNKVNNFDIDLDFGQIYEKTVRDIFQGDGSIEVKTERDIWKTTGNVAFEIRYKGRPSGISITNAKWWCEVFTIDGDIKFIYLIETLKLRKIIKYLCLETDLTKNVMGGDNNQSELVLIPIKELINCSSGKIK